MKAKKFEWFTFEDSMTDALAFNNRMMNFLFSANLNYLHLTLEIELFSLGYKDGDTVFVNGFNGHGYVYLDVKEAQYLEDKLNLSYIDLNPGAPDRIDVITSWGRFTDIEIEEWNEKVEFDFPHKNSVHFEPSSDDIPLSIFRERNINHFSSLDGKRYFDLNKVQIDQDGNYIHYKSKEFVKPNNE
ncbi:hypothetical protein [Paracholeplasma brassicae]|nr:hypothetical protein [Paracholeplasma brassicae]